MVPTNDDWRFQLALAHHFVEAKSKAMALAITQPTNACRQTLESNALFGQAHPLVQAVVVGDLQPYLVALLTLDPERPVSAQALQRGVDAVNAHLAQYETIKRFVVLPGDFSVEGGELTPTQKVKRKVVSEKYAAEIAALYAAGQ